MEVVVRLADYLWRPLTDSDEDTEFVLSLRNSPAAQASFGTRTISRDQHRYFMNRAEADDEINWIIQKRGERVGQFGIFHIDRKNRKAEGGRLVATSPELFVPAAFVCWYVAFEHLGLNRVYGEILAHNTVVCQAWERLGIVKEGVSRQHMIIDGIPTDVCLYGTLASDWQEIKPRLIAQYGEPQIVRSWE